MCKIVRRRFLYIIVFLLSGSSVFSQTSGFIDRFDDGVPSTAWAFNLLMTFTETDSMQKIEAKPWKQLKFGYSTPSHLTIASRPFLSLIVKADSAFVLGIYLKSNGQSSRTLSLYVPSTGKFTELVYDFSGYFNGIDSTWITDVFFCPNPTDAYKGVFYIDDLAMGDSASIPAPRCTSVVPPLDTVNIVIAADSIKLLDQHPYDTSVYGAFYDGDSLYYPGVEMQYKGAYTLLDMLYKGPERNWKLKFPKTQLYTGDRKWNYNRDYTLREKMVYDLFGAAGVANTEPRYVRLNVNGASHGLYIEYVDPDIKNFLSRWFGDNDGDLYKSAMDLPGLPVYFGGLNYLGDKDSCYYFHYDKKTNNKDVPMDYSSIRKFVTMLTFIPNDQFYDTLNRYFDVPSFLKYLVISNFVNNWDDFPVRPKNFFVYQRSTDFKWFLLPWDLNSTFEMRYDPQTYYGMGAGASIFYFLYHPEIQHYSVGEDTLKVLVDRMMRYAQYRNAYVIEYRKALQTYLKPENLMSRLDSMERSLACNLSAYEYRLLQTDNAEVRAFIDIKSKAVAKELVSVTMWDTVPVTDYYPPGTKISANAAADRYAVGEAFPNPSGGDFGIPVSLPCDALVHCRIYTAGGVCIREQHSKLNQGVNELRFSIPEPGIYFLQLSSDPFICTRKIIIR